MMLSLSLELLQYFAANLSKRRKRKRKRERERENWKREQQETQAAQAHHRLQMYVSRRSGDVHVL
jgi:hypothetical protein